jgi:DNA-binding response OmpR family regulator
MITPTSLPNAPAPVGRLGGKRVLVLEDDPTLRHLLVHALGADYAVHEASDGLAGLQLLRQIAVPDLIICDVMMPHIDGFAFARRIRERKALARVPLIFLTARTDAPSIVEGINAGARHYIKKPFKIEELLERARQLLPP